MAGNFVRTLFLYFFRVIGAFVSINILSFLADTMQRSSNCNFHVGRGTVGRVGGGRCQRHFLYVTDLALPAIPPHKMTEYDVLNFS